MPASSFESTKSTTLLRGNFFRCRDDAKNDSYESFLKILAHMLLDIW